LTVAFVLGNGTSRRQIELTNLKSQGTVYGCNALYRDFDPDYLIAVDSKMVVELNREKYQTRTQVWTNFNKLYSEYSGFNYFKQSKGWSSGPTALWMASEHGHDVIYIIGFDYQGIGNENQIVNNMYSGTENYKKIDDRATYYGNWLKQTVATIKKNPKKRYIRVLGDNKFIPKDFEDLLNLTHITVEEFNKSSKNNYGI
jgi:hypothetical protein